MLQKPSKFLMFHWTTNHMWSRPFTSRHLSERYTSRSPRKETAYVIIGKSLTRVDLSIRQWVCICDNRERATEDQSSRFLRYHRTHPCRCALSFHPRKEKRAMTQLAQHVSKMIPSLNRDLLHDAREQLERTRDGKVAPLTRVPRDQMSSLMSCR